MKIKLLLLLFLTFNTKTDILPNVLQKYTNSVFVCTGIASGTILTHAIEINCINGAFRKIYGIEENGILADHSRKFVIPNCVAYYKPKNLNLCEIYHKNSISDLADVINKVDKPITFVLASQFPDWTDPKKNNFILYELDQIKKHRIKKHIILIDYIYFGNINLENLKNKLLEINSKYKFKFEDGGHLGKEKDAVLVAYFK